MRRRSWKSRRDRALRAEGFLPFERYGRRDKRGRLRGLINESFRRIGWFRAARRQRVREFSQYQALAVENHWSRAMFRREWANFIIRKYQDNRWLLADGSLDVWEMFRALRAEAIKSGKWYETPPRPGSHRRTVIDPETGLKYRIDKGKAREQGARWREKRREKAGAR